MPIYLSSIIPFTTGTDWTRKIFSNRTEFTYKVDTNTLNTDMLFHFYGYDTAPNASLIEGSFLTISYTDILTSEVHNICVSLFTHQIDFYFNLPAATVNSIVFKVIFFGEYYTYWKFYLCPIEQPIRSIDIEYAVGDRLSKDQTIIGEIPNEDAWQSEVPTWSGANLFESPVTVNRVWFRAVITYDDGHIGYSVPTVGVFFLASSQYTFTKLYYLSNSEYELKGGSWSENIPVWSSGKHIFACMKYTEEGSTSAKYTPAMLAQAFLPAITHYPAIKVETTESIPKVPASGNIEPPE